MELRDALTQISEIRSAMARTQVFRGFRAATTAFSGVLAVVAAALQAALVPVPADRPYAYLALWLTAAAVSMAVVGAEMTLRARRLGSALQTQLTLLVVEQFLPAVVAGALLTAVVMGFALQLLWLLPALWLVLFGLGMFAACRLLPRETFCIAGYYLLAGLIVLIASTRGWALSPWVMGVPFGVGQLATSIMLYLRLERRHG